MKLKVCGIHPAKNDLALVSYTDYLGFIFYEKSKRNVLSAFYNKIKEINGVQKIGVFVDANFEDVIFIANNCGLEMIQLHGKETPAFCNEIRNKFPVIKAISIKQASDLEKCEQYLNSVDYFLFDTKGPLPGGNGYAFDWKVLEKYNYEIPFFLSGGIALEDVGKIRNIDFEKLFAIDVNSKFESEPGVKILEDVKMFSERLNG